MILFSGRLLYFILLLFSVLSNFSSSASAPKRRIIRLLTPLSKNASSNGRRLFQNIANNEMQDIDIIYMKLSNWAKNEGPNFMVGLIYNLKRKHFRVSPKKAFDENMKKAEKEAYEKREELGIEIDQLPSLVIDAIQIVDIFRQDPTKSNLEEKKMINDLKRTVEPLFVNRYQIILDRAQKLQDEYGINLFRSPFAKRRKSYFKSDEL
uniref:SXP/RAL-2 family protein Ani s 5-like cation-binding domain-containing protein n=1 Tax=Wuchereria bancrofti TaxID=6293 RepID=A0A1I8F061_WUCBA